MPHTSPPLVSIIIVNYNGEQFLKSCLVSVGQVDYSNYEVIIVDNFSRDNSRIWLQTYVKEHFNCRLILNQLNVGFAQANNQAAAQAGGEYLFFLNNDTKVTPEALSILVNKMKNNPQLGICGCQILSYDGRQSLHSGLGIDIFGYPVNPLIREERHSKRKKDRTGRKIFYIEGSALMIRRSVFEEIGEFDVKYFMFHEDIDLAWRVWLVGWQVGMAEQAKVYHFGGGAAGGFVSQGRYQSTFFRRYYSERNNIRTLLKNYKLITLFFILPLYCLVNLLEMVLFALTLRPKVIVCYFRAWLWNILNFRDTLQARNRIQATRKMSDREIFKKMFWTSGKFLMFKKIGLPYFK